MTPPGGSNLILLVEDDDGHATLVERNLRRAGVANDIVRVRDGQEGLDFVARAGAHAARATPDPVLVLLDIHMPRVDGVEVLGRLKARQETAAIPVIMLTTTDDPRDVERCYKAGCSVFISKPVSYDAFVEAVRRLGLFLQIVVLPRGGQG